MKKFDKKPFFIKNIQSSNAIVPDITLFPRLNPRCFQYSPIRRDMKMNISKAVARRILELCKERKITVNKLSTLSAVTQSTVNDIVNNHAKNIGIVTIKKLCDGLEISVCDFFDTDYFRNLEQEIY